MDYVDEDVQRDTTLQLADDEDQSKRSHRRQASMEEADGSITRSHRRQASWRKLTVASMAGISFTCLPDISELRQGAHCNTDKIAV